MIFYLAFMWICHLNIFFITGGQFVHWRKAILTILFNGLVWNIFMLLFFGFRPEEDGV